MKAFIISLIILLLMFILIIWNSIYISKITDTLNILTTEINEASSTKELETLINYWNKHKLLISISVPHNEVDEMEKQLLLLKDDIENHLNFHNTKVLVLKAIEEIKIHATLNADNVF